MWFFAMAYDDGKLLVLNDKDIQDMSDRGILVRVLEGPFPSYSEAKIIGY